MTKAFISALAYYLPEAILDNEQLANEFPELPPEKIFAKTGIRERHIAAPTEFVIDMAVAAAEKLFVQEVERSQIDFLLFCTQTPDYILPTCACVIQERLGLSMHIGALDINLGCSGYIYGLSLAKALIESGQAKNVLLLTADTYSKLIEDKDKTVKTIFGDGAAATMVSAMEATHELMSKAVYGTNGKGAENLCVQGFGMRAQNQKNIDPYLRMKGPQIFEFTLEIVPKNIAEILTQVQVNFEDVDLFVFHQANHYMLEHLRKKLNIAQEKFIVEMDFCGNTVSSSIPIALKEAQKKGALKKKQKVLLVGFGIGYSWGSILVDLSRIHY